MNHLETALRQHEAGQIDAAIASYRAVLAENPQHPDALHLMGVIAQQRGNSQLALKLIEAALATNPQMAWAWFNRSIVLRALLQIDEALQSAEQALILDPTLADAWDMAGSLLRQKMRYDEARSHHERALHLQPHNIAFQRNFASLLLTLGEVSRAFNIVHPDKRPDVMAEDIPLVTGHILQAAGYPQRAIPFYHETFIRHPELTNIHTDEALANLKIGHFDEGWKLWQTRSDNFEELFPNIPKWQGEKAEHIILYEDQGLGDILHAIRYIPIVREHVRSLTLHLITDALKRLLAFNFPDLTIIIPGDPLPKADTKCRLMNLPYLFKTNLDTIPASVPYLHAPLQDIAKAQEKLAGSLRPLIGLVWAGNINYPKNYSRSLHFDQLSPLLEAASGHIISLQKGPQREQADFVANTLLDIDPWLDDFAATAGFIETLDLVITVDTAVAHLAGGMGKPVWILLPFDPDWRWMLEREDSPWYPTARLFRQMAPHGWSSVIGRVTEDLKKFLQGDRDILKPEIWTKSPATENTHALPLWD